MWERPTWPKASENAESHQIKATCVVNPANMSDFKKDFRRKQTVLLSEDSTSINKREHFNPAGATQHAELKI